MLYDNLYIGSRCTALIFIIKMTRFVNFTSLFSNANIILRSQHIVYSNQMYVYVMSSAVVDVFGVHFYCLLVFVM